MLTILSTPMLLEDGDFRAETISLEKAKQLVSESEIENYCGHQTIKLLDLDPTTARKVCTGFSTALVLKPNGRLEFGKEYSIDEILEVGVTPMLITKL